MMECTAVNEMQRGFHILLLLIFNVEPCGIRPLYLSCRPPDTLYLLTQFLTIDTHTAVSKHQK